MLNPVTYIKEVTSELKKVSWPGKKHTTDMTILVIAVCLVVALYLTGVDLVLNKFITNLINR